MNMISPLDSIPQVARYGGNLNKTIDASNDLCSHLWVGLFQSFLFCFLQKWK